MNSFCQFRLLINFDIYPMINGLEILCIYCRCWWCWFQNKQPSNERLPLYYRNDSWLKLTTVKKSTFPLLSFCDRWILLTKNQLCGKKIVPLHLKLVHSLVQILDTFFLILLNEECRMQVNVHLAPHKHACCGNSSKNAHSDDLNLGRNSIWKGCLISIGNPIVEIRRSVIRSSHQ